MNYYGKMRTNWFKVTDKEMLAEYVSELEGEGLCIRVRSSDNLFCITCNGELYYDGRSVNDSGFYNLMQKIIAEDDAMIVMEIGSEGTRYFVAYADIITRNSITYVNLEESVTFKVREILKRPWTGKFNY